MWGLNHSILTSRSSLVFLDFLGSLDQATEPTAERTESVVSCITLKIHWGLSSDILSSTWILYFSLASVLSSMMGTQGVMNKLGVMSVKSSTWTVRYKLTSSAGRGRHSCPGPQRCCRSGNTRTSRRNSLNRSRGYCNSIIKEVLHVPMSSQQLKVPWFHSLDMLSVQSWLCLLVSVPSETMPDI